MKQSIKKIVELMMFLGLLIQCKEKSPENSPEKYDTKTMVTSITNNYIIPAYQNYKTNTTNLLDLINIFISNPTEVNLQNCQNQWKSTALSWQDVAMLDFGPAKTINLRAQTNIYPVDTTLIKSNILSNSYDLQQPENFDAKGLQTLDYLLFIPAMTNNQIVNYYSTNSNAKTYLSAICSELKSNAFTVFNQWNTTYKTSFINNIESNAVGTSVSDIVNALSLHFEAFVRKGKVGIPLGVFNGITQQIMPGHVEAFYSDYSVALALRSIEAFDNYIKGKTYNSFTNGEGLDDYLNFVKAKNNNQDLSIVIENKLNEIKTNLNALGGSLKDAITTNNSAVQTLYQSMQELVPLIKVEMTANLGVLIDYQDSDGD